MAVRSVVKVGVWVIAALAVYGCVVSMPDPKPKTPEEIAAERVRAAMFRCEGQTESQLADADGFDPEPYGQWLVQEASEDRFVWTFKARARNAFGGLVWASFECTATNSDAGWTAAIRQL